jgi:hypothetical protein
MEYYEDVFFQALGKEFCDTEKAVSILLEKRILFCNTREYVEKVGKPTNTYIIEPKTIVLFVNCNDLFMWGCADAECITVEEIPILYRMWKKESGYGVDKWVCKKRNLQPQKLVRDEMKKANVWEDWMDKLDKNN